MQKQGCRLRWKFICCLALLGLLFGCSRNSAHPELSKTNSEGASEWKRYSPNHPSGDLVLYSIRAGNRIDTPAGEKVATFGIFCSAGYGSSLDVSVSTGMEPESGDVNIGFDGAALVNKKWKPQFFKSANLHSLVLPDDDRNDFFRQLRQAKTLQFSFTPKGGKPQLSSFKLLNITSLLGQEQSCRSLLDHLQ